MEVILLQKVENLGKLGERVHVKPGYGRNYLIPSGRAQAATSANLAAFEVRRAELERAATDALSAAEARKASITALGAVTIARRAGEEGKLFGSIGTGDIAEAVTAAGVALSRQEVRLPMGPIRALGEQTVALHLHTDVEASVVINVVAEKG